MIASDREDGPTRFVRELVEVLATSGDRPDERVDRFERLLGVRLPRVGARVHGCIQRLDDRSIAVISYETAPRAVLRVRLAPADDEAEPPVTPALAHVLDRLSAFGFRVRPWTGEHGRRMGAYVRRQRLVVGIAATRHPDGGVGDDIVTDVHARWKATP